MILSRLLKIAAYAYAIISGGAAAAQSIETRNKDVANANANANPAPFLGPIVASDKALSSAPDQALILHDALLDALSTETDDLNSEVDEPSTEALQLSDTATVTTGEHTYRVEEVGSSSTAGASTTKVTLVETATATIIAEAAGPLGLLTHTPSGDFSQFSPKASWSEGVGTGAEDVKADPNTNTLYVAFSNFGMRKLTMKPDATLENAGEIPFTTIYRLDFDPQVNSLVMCGQGKVMRANAADLTVSSLDMTDAPYLYSTKIISSMGMAVIGGGVQNNGLIIFINSTNTNTNSTHISEVAPRLSTPDIVFGLDFFEFLYAAIFKKGVIGYDLSVSPPKVIFQYKEGLDTVYSVAVIPGTSPLLLIQDYTAGLVLVGANGNGTDLGVSPYKQQGNGVSIEYAPPYYFEALGGGGFRLSLIHQFAAKFVTTLDIGAPAIGAAALGDEFVIRSAGSVRRFVVGSTPDAPVTLTPIRDVVVPGLADTDSCVAMDTGCIYLAGTQFTTICGNNPPVTIAFDPTEFGPDFRAFGLVIEGNMAYMAGTNGYFVMPTAGGVPTFKAPGFSAVDVARSPGSPETIVAPRLTQELKFFNAASEVASIALSATPFSLALLPGNKIIIAACYVDGKLVYADVQTKKVVTTFSLPSTRFQPYTVVCHPSEPGLCYVGNRVTGRVMGFRLLYTEATGAAEVEITGSYKTEGLIGRPIAFINRGYGIIVIPRGAGNTDVVMDWVPYSVPQLPPSIIEAYPGEERALTELSITGYGVPSTELQVVIPELPLYVRFYLPGNPNAVSSYFYSQAVTFKIDPSADNNSHLPRAGVQTVDGLKFDENGVVIHGSGFSPMPPNTPWQLQFDIIQELPYLVFGSVTFPQGGTLPCGEVILGVYAGNGQRRSAGIIKASTFPNLAFMDGQQPTQQFTDSDCASRIVVKHVGGINGPGAITAQAQIGVVSGTPQTSTPSGFEKTAVLPSAIVNRALPVGQNATFYFDGTEITFYDFTVANSNTSSALELTLFIPGIQISPSPFTVAHYHNRQVSGTGGYDYNPPAAGSAKVVIINRFTEGFPPGTLPGQVEVTVQTAYAPNPQAPIPLSLPMRGEQDKSFVVSAPLVRSDGFIAEDELVIELRTTDGTFKRGEDQPAATVNGTMRQYDSAVISATFTDPKGRFEWRTCSDTLCSDWKSDSATITAVDSSSGNPWWVTALLSAAIGIPVTFGFWRGRAKYDNEQKKSIPNILIKTAGETKYREELGGGLYAALVNKLVHAFYAKYQVKGRDFCRARRGKSEQYIRGLEALIAAFTKKLPRIKEMASFFDVREALFGAGSNPENFTAEQKLLLFLNSKKIDSSKKVTALSALPGFAELFVSVANNTGRSKATVSDDDKLAVARNHYKKYANAFAMQEGGPFALFLKGYDNEELLMLFLQNNKLTPDQKVRELEKLPQFKAFFALLTASENNAEKLNQIEKMAKFFNKFKNGLSYGNLSEADIEQLIQLWLNSIDKHFEFDDNTSPKPRLSACPTSCKCSDCCKQFALEPKQLEDKPEAPVVNVGCCESFTSCLGCNSSSEVIEKSDVAPNDDRIGLLFEEENRYNNATSIAEIACVEWINSSLAGATAAIAQLTPPTPKAAAGSGGSGVASPTGADIKHELWIDVTDTDTKRPEGASDSLFSSAARKESQPVGSKTGASQARLLSGIKSPISAGGAAAGTPPTSGRRATTQRGRDAVEMSKIENNTPPPPPPTVHRNSYY